ncbi:hypothetical protein [Aeromonas tecta]|uniref:hypothetical protein n=1 Tax=Aeromonas tecta TaxID=324617 RepID=UPI0006805E1F|nr:hypothetical protein [Aeromonas tecta]
MKIKTEKGNAVDIYGIYWVMSIDRSNTETILLGLPKGNGGLSPYRITGDLAEKVEFIDSTLPNGFVYSNSGVYHWSLIEEGLLDDLLEYDEIAYGRFIDILKDEGKIEQDFF